MTKQKTAEPKAPGPSKAAKAPDAQPQVEAAEQAQDTGIPGAKATADELAYFIRHNPTYWTLPPEDRDALSRRLIEAKRGQPDARD